jgi:hypothetical protein
MPIEAAAGIEVICATCRLAMKKRHFTDDHALLRRTSAQIHD